MQAPLLEFRVFFYGVFAEHSERRLALVKQWHTSALVQSKRLSGVFAFFMRKLLVLDALDPLHFSMQRDHFCLFDASTLRIPYAWLNEGERAFLVQRVFRQRARLFKTRNVYVNGELLLRDFVHDSSMARLYDVQWGREMVRDFAWMVVARGQPHVVHELIVAMQQLMVDTPRGRRDVFLKALHDGVQGSVDIAQVPCWGLDAHDLHSEERESLKTKERLYITRRVVKNKMNESGSAPPRLKRVSWLNLHEFIPQRDVRQLIYKKLTKHERLTVELAHGIATTKMPSIDFVRYVTLNGFIFLLQWARSQGAPWDESTCADAARHGHLNVLQWARSEGAPWDESTCAEAAYSGHLHVLQWARSQGAPWGGST